MGWHPPVCCPTLFSSHSLCLPFHFYLKLRSFFNLSHFCIPNVCDTFLPHEVKALSIPKVRSHPLQRIHVSVMQVWSEAYRVWQQGRESVNLQETWAKATSESMRKVCGSCEMTQTRDCICWTTSPYGIPYTGFTTRPGVHWAGERNLWAPFPFLYIGVFSPILKSLILRAKCNANYLVNMALAYSSDEVTIPVKEKKKENCISTIHPIK